ncbi:PLD nuclease N-terminal domain-containing protein [Halobacillus litoralis]|uniref:PLD nuclease N-terminal domain-containing protein n=1 Tax=Halobacillus litoralis TaxID=45668 RepID=UPI001CFCB075|nr:PLD nuclease N-terminal domain-containing protein [Halobacillus litoralis]
MLLTQTVIQTIEENLPVLLPLFIIQLLLMITALVSLIRATSTRGPKWMWIIIILFLNTIGPIVYFIIGRRDDL